MCDVLVALEGGRERLCRLARHTLIARDIKVAADFPHYDSAFATVDTLQYGGEGGIRTLDGLSTHTHFPGVLLKPLGHLSDGGDHISHTPAHEFAATVAPFRAWRG